ncbi:MAG: hypothetical protein GEU99_07695 [Luteitalea sp.]|nr:hypothetical protein [Luteitalea sp.]
MKICYGRRSSSIMANGSHHGVPPAEPGQSTESAAIEAALQRVLASQTFSKAPVLRALLEYLAHLRAESVSEYAIATEALGRRADFDPKTDATVRVQISRLRTKLKQFYDGEGAQHAVRLDLPLGEHRIVVQRVAPSVEPAALLGAVEARPLPLAPRPVARLKSWPGVTAATIVGLLVAIGAWSAAVRDPFGTAATPVESPRFWRAFFDGGQRARLIFPTPVFYHWPKRSLRIRDFAINEYADFGKSSGLRPLVNRYGKPELSQSYSVASDTTAAIRLTQHLTKLGYPLLAGATGDLPLEAFGDDHIIFLGIPATTSHVHESLKRTNFWMEPSATVVHNRRPLAGERTAYSSVKLSDRRRRELGVVALLPGKAGSTKLLVIAGDNTAAVSSCLIAVPSLELLDRLWTRHGPQPVLRRLTTHEHPRRERHQRATAILAGLSAIHVGHDQRRQHRPGEVPWVASGIRKAVLGWCELHGQLHVFAHGRQQHDQPRQRPLVLSDGLIA